MKFRNIRKQLISFATARRDVAAELPQELEQVQARYSAPRHPVLAAKKGAVQDPQRERKSCLFPAVGNLVRR